MAALKLDANAADFLASAVYWRLVMGGSFYKFNKPCGHPAYQDGDSWLEELGIGETAFYPARQRVATKNVTGHALKETLASTAVTCLVLFWTTDERKTWYDVRLDLLCELLGQALNLHIIANKRPPVEAHSQTVTSVSPSEIAPQPADGEPAAQPPFDEASVSDLSNPLEPEGLMKIGVSGITSSIYSLNKEEEGGNVEVDKAVLLIAQRLQHHGVWEVPSLEIALRARDAGLNGDETLAVFQEHVRQLASTKAPDEVIPMATWRMQHLRLEPPIQHEPKCASRGHRASNGRRGESVQMRTEGRVEDHSGASNDAVPDEEAIMPVEVRTESRLWQAVLDDVKLQMTRATFETWMKRTELIRAEEGTYTVATSNPSAIPWLENRLGRVIQKTLERHVMGPVALEFTIGAEIAP